MVNQKYLNLKLDPDKAARVHLVYANAATLPRGICLGNSATINTSLVVVSRVADADYMLK